MKTRDTLVIAVLTTLALFGAGVVLLPLYIVVVTAFKSPPELAKSYFSPPAGFFTGNFNRVFQTDSYLRSVANSTIVTVVSVALIVLIIPIVSWAISRNMNKRYFKFLYFYFIAGIFIPFNVIMVPLVKLTSQLHMMNIWGLVILNLTCAMIQGIFLFSGFIKSVPMELEEAAYIDGCGIFRTFILVIFPLLKPILATFIVIRGLFIWNDFQMPLIILNKSRSFWTLPIFQYNFRSQYTVDYGSAFASYLLAIIPVIIVYVLMQKYIVKGLTAGAVKS